MSTGKMLFVVVVVGVVTFLIDGAVHGMALKSTYGTIAAFDGTENVSPLWWLIVDLTAAALLVWFYGKVEKNFSSPIVYCLGIGILVSIPNVFVSALMIKGFPYWLAWVWVAVNLVDYGVSGVIITLLDKPRAA